MKKLARFALIITLSAAYFPSSLSSAAPTAPNERWLNDSAGYARALELQRQLEVPLVVYFYTDRCPYCRTLDSQYLPSAPVQDYLQGVIKVRINPEHGQAERALAKRYGVSDYPSFFVMRNPAARPVNVQPFRRVRNLTPMQFANSCRANAPISQKVAAVRKPGTSGKFRERPGELEITKTTTKGGAQIITVTPAAPASPRGKQ